MRIYADNASTTKMTRTVINGMIYYMNEIYGNPSSSHSVGRRAYKAINNARKRIANTIGCTPKEITFTSGGSEADNQAIFSVAQLGKKSGKKHIISTSFEHHAVLDTLTQLENDGFDITLLDVHENGIIFPEQVINALRTDTCLVSIMYANNEIGTIQPIEEIGHVCRERGIILHTDAVQAAGHIHIDVHKQNIDMLSLSAHKFHGPKGIGVLYTRKGIPLSSIIQGGSQEQGKRAGTENVPAIMGMTIALEESCNRINDSIIKLTAMRDKIITGLSKIPHSLLNGDKVLRLPSNVNFCFEGIDGEALVLLLDDKGIYASSAAACTTGLSLPSHVLLSIGRSYELARSSLRLSLSEDITEKDVDYIINCVTDAVKYLRSKSPVWCGLNNNT